MAMVVTIAVIVLHFDFLVLEALVDSAPGIWSPDGPNFQSQISGDTPICFQFPSN